MNQPIVSVIIPTYDEEKNIGQLLEQLTGLPGIEIIVSDGGSLDKTSEICSNYSIKFISGASGRGRQLNTGAQNSIGDILFFLHADSKIQTGIFDEIRTAVEKGCRWGCCSLHFDEDNLFFRLVAFASRLRVSVLNSCYGDQGIFCERNLYFTVEGFPDIPLMEDIVLSRKLRRYFRACSLAGKIITSGRRFREGGLMRTLIKMQFLKLLFVLGVPAERLINLYKPVRQVKL